MDRIDIALSVSAAIKDYLEIELSNVLASGVDKSDIELMFYSEGRNGRAIITVEGVPKYEIALKELDTSVDGDD